MSGAEFVRHEVGDQIEMEGETYQILDFVDRMGQVKLARVTFCDLYGEEYDCIEEYMRDNGEEDEDGNTIEKFEEDLTEHLGVPFWMHYKDIEEDY